MTLLFFDGFETYDAGATMASGLEDVYAMRPDIATTEIFITPSTRIPGGQAMRIDTALGSHSGTNPTYGPQLPLAGYAAGDTWVFGVAIKASSLGAGGTVRSIFQLYSSEGEDILALRLHANGDLTVDRFGVAGSIVTLETESAAIADANWHYIEFKTKLHNSTGTWEVHLDEVTIMNGTGDTDNLVRQPACHLRMGHIQSAIIDYDDLYILDTTGSVNNDFLGDVLVQRLRPNGDTLTKDFTRSTGSTNWDLINELGEDDDSTYVESKTLAQRDLYEYEDLPMSAATIYAVIAKPVLRKSEPGSRTCKLLCFSDPIEDETGTIYPSTSYVRQAKLFETDPATSALWTDAGVNDAQFGVEIVS